MVGGVLVSGVLEVAEAVWVADLLEQADSKPQYKKEAAPQGCHRGAGTSLLTWSRKSRDGDLIRLGEARDAEAVGGNRKYGGNGGLWSGLVFFVICGALAVWRFGVLPGWVLLGLLRSGGGRVGLNAATG